MGGRTLGSADAETGRLGNRPEAVPPASEVLGQKKSAPALFFVSPGFSGTPRA